MKDLLAVAMLSGIYGLLSASFFVTMDAVDVAFTEASVGAGISTLLMLTTIAIVGRFERSQRHKPSLALAVTFFTGVLLIYGTLDMPYFGSPNAPANQHVAPQYLNDTVLGQDKSVNQVGVPNVVTAVLASYRGFDTFGEVAVIFTAGIGVLALLAVVRRPEEDAKIAAINESMHQKNLILRIVIKVLIPFILLFALYVQFHGDYGPGGGFQAGVIFAAAFILYAMLFGLSTARRVINQTLIQILAAIGVLIYGSVGLVSILNGRNFLDYNALSSDSIAGQHLGILVIELGVGITVTSVMVIIFFNFAGRLENREANESVTRNISSDGHVTKEKL